VIAALVLIAAAAALLIFVRPFVGLPIVFFLGMIGDLQHFTGGISVVKGIVVLMALGFAVRYSFASVLRSKTGVEIPLVLFVAIYCLGNALRPSTTFDTSVILTWVGYPVAFLLVLHLANTRRRIEWVLGALVAGAIFAGIASAIEQFFGVNLLSSLRGVDEAISANGPLGVQRISGLLQDANSAAYMHIFAIPIIISLILLSRSWAQRFGLMGLSLVSLFSLLLTFSRSGYIAVVLGVACLLFYLNLRKAIWVLLLSSLLVVIALAYVPAATVMARFYNIREDMGGDDDRSLYYLVGSRLIVEHPLMPAGETAFKSAISEKTAGGPNIPHSNILSAGISGGLIGLSAFFWLLYRYVRYVHRGLGTMRSKPLLYYALGTYAGTVGFQVQGLFITNFGWFLMWAAAAIPICCILADRRESAWRCLRMRAAQLPNLCGSAQREQMNASGTAFVGSRKGSMSLDCLNEQE
jgi:putative inorganic carbon (hco3(-)) transporter